MSVSFALGNCKMTRMRLSLVLVLAGASWSCDSSVKKILSGSTCVVEQSDLREKLTRKERDVFRTCYADVSTQQNAVRDYICRRAGCLGEGLHTLGPWVALSSKGSKDGKSNLGQGCNTR